MTPEIADHLADHRVRIEKVESLALKVEAKLDKLLWAVIGGQSTLLLFLVGLLLKRP